MVILNHVYLLYMYLYIYNKQFKYFFAVPAEVVWAVSGEDAELPCDMSVPPGDRVNICLLYTS